MIRINLLPVKQIKQRVQTRNEVLAFICMFVALLIIVGFVGYGQASKIKKLEIKTAELEQEKKKYESVIRRIKKIKKEQALLETKLQVTILRTVKNEEIIVPNSLILNSNVVNYSVEARDRGLILHTTVSIGYDTPWRQVHAMLLMAARKTPGLLDGPEPFVRQKSLDDFYVTYELNVYTDKPEKMAGFYSELHQNILDVFNEYGVQIMSPNYKADRAEPAIVPKARWYAPPAKSPDEV